MDVPYLEIKSYSIALMYKRIQINFLTRKKNQLENTKTLLKK